jgi:hypothetical protein
MGQTRKRAPDKETLARLDAMVELIPRFMTERQPDLPFHEKRPKGIWTYVDNRLTKQGFTARSANDFARFKDYILNKLNVLNDKPIQDSLIPSEHPEHSKPVEDSDQSKHSKPSEYSVSDFEKAVNGIFDKRIAELQQLARIIHNDKNDIIMPPERVRVKPPDEKHRPKGETRKYIGLGVSVDRVLREHFDAEAKRRGLTYSGLMEVILYSRYGKPKLSYEKD